MNPDHSFQSWVPSVLMEPSRLDARFYNPSHVSLIAALASSPTPHRSLGELVTHLAHVTGYESTKYMEFVNDRSGVKVVEAMNVGDTLIDGSDWKRIRQAGYDGLPRHQLQNEDIVFSKDGTLGNCALVTSASLPAVASRHVFRIIPKRKLVDPGYLTVWLSSSAGRTQTTYRQAGAVQGTIITPEVAAFHVLIPDVGTQKAIGNKVRKAQRLRELATDAESLFDQWMHVATASGRAPIEVLRLLSHVPADTCADVTWVLNFDPADRVDPWPHHLAPRTIQSQLLGAGARSFDEFFEAVSSQRGRANPPLAPNCYFLSILDIDAKGHIDWTHAAQTRYESDGTIVKSDDVLYSTLNPQEARVGVIGARPNDAIACSSEFAILRLTANAPRVPFLLAAVLRSHWLRVQASFLTRSSSLSRRRLDEGDLAKLLIPWNDNGIQALNDKLAQAVSARHESVSLVAAAKADVEALIDGTLDEPGLLADGEAITAWLAKHPRPHDTQEVRHAG